MGILRKDKSEFDIYENHNLGILVAISCNDNKKIIDYKKKHKGVKKPPIEMVSGYKFILDKEIDSLKIDFNSNHKFPINDLVKFK